MKKLVLSFTVVMVITGIAMADEIVRGYWRDTDGDGVKDTYVNSYHRSDRDGNPFNNYSTKGNINPWTGERGYKNPYNNNGAPFGTGYRYR